MKEYDPEEVESDFSMSKIRVDLGKLLPILVLNKSDEEVQML